MRLDISRVTAHRRGTAVVAAEVDDHATTAVVQDTCLETALMADPVDEGVAAVVDVVVNATNVERLDTSLASAQVEMVVAAAVAVVT